MECTKSPLVVTFAGFGGAIELPCYKGDNGHYYFDTSDGKAKALHLATGAYKDEESGEICGELNVYVDRQVICEEPFYRSKYEFQYSMLERRIRDCEYFLGYGFGAEWKLYDGTIEKTCDAMDELYESFPDSAKPDWISKEKIQEYREKMLAVRAEKDRKHTRI